MKKNGKKKRLPGTLYRYVRKFHDHLGFNVQTNVQTKMFITFPVRVVRQSTRYKPELVQALLL